MNGPFPKLLQAALSKRGLVRNQSYDGNEFNLYVNETYFHMKGGHQDSL